MQIMVAGNYDNVINMEYFNLHIDWEIQFGKESLQNDLTDCIPFGFLEQSFVDSYKQT